MREVFFDRTQTVLFLIWLAMFVVQAVCFAVLIYAVSLMCKP